MTSARGDDAVEDGGAVAGTDTAATATPVLPMSTIFNRFWPYTRGFRARMTASLVLTAVAPALTAAGVYLYKVLVDDVLTPHDFRLFLPVAALYVVITMAQGVATWCDECLTAWVGERFVTNLRVAVFEHLQRLSLGFFERRQLGDILSRLGGDVAAVEGLVLTGVNMALTYAFQVVFYAGMLFWLDWRLALAALAAAPGFLLVTRSLSGKIRAAARELRRRAGSIGAVAEESLGNLALVQAYDRQRDETDRYRRENAGVFSAQMVAIRLEALFGPLSELVELVGVLAVMGFAVWELANGRITLGGLLVFVAYLSQLYGPVAGFGGLWNSVSSAAAGAERIIEVLDQRPAVRESADPVPLERAHGAVGLHGVTFTYPATERPALCGIDLAAAPGEKVAIVGASGAGKTTLTKLLLRFYDPDSGTVTLDGRDVRELSLSDLRRNIAAVLQETLVFDGTIADNIRWGRPDATDDDVERAARAADVHRFVQDLPDGYATRVGQRGRLLSGGQRQRLAIARAMIRDAPVLLLDEPTTGLDAESSERVLEPLRRLMSGRTTLIISHNLLTVTDADRILFLEDGRVSASGTHRELLVHSPGYARLYRLHHPDAADLARAVPAAGPRTGRHRAGASRHAADCPRPTQTPEAAGPRVPGHGDRTTASIPGQSAGPASRVLPSDVPADGGVTGWFGLPPGAPVPPDGALSSLPPAEPVPSGPGTEHHVRRGRHAAPPTPRPRRDTESTPSAGGSTPAPLSVPPATS
jgi:ATP-binding cassette, subfamily B, bacterial